MNALIYAMVIRSAHAAPITRSGLILDGILGIPPHSSGIIIFTPSSGSGRLSPRNNFVARFLQQKGRTTLLLDLLTPEKAEDATHLFEEPGTLEQIAGHAKKWFQRYLHREREN